MRRARFLEPSAVSRCYPLARPWAVHCGEARRGLSAQVPSIQEDPAKWAPILKKICWYSVLAPHGSDQVSCFAAQQGFYPSTLVRCQLVVKSISCALQHFKLCRDLTHVPLCCQVTLLQATAGDKKLAELPAYKELLSTFTTQEARPHAHAPLICCTMRNERIAQDCQQLAVAGIWLPRILRGLLYLHHARYPHS